jgi:hypothetical protein
VLELPEAPLTIPVHPHNALTQNAPHPATANGRRLFDLDMSDPPEARGHPLHSLHSVSHRPINFLLNALGVLITKSDLSARNL